MQKVYIAHILDKKDGIHEEVGVMAHSHSDAFAIARVHAEKQYGKRGFDLKVLVSEMKFLQ